MSRTTTEMIRKLNSFYSGGFHIHIDKVSMVLPVLKGLLHGMGK